MEENKEAKGIPGSTLKIIAIITMFIDHVGASLLEHYLRVLKSEGADYCSSLITSRLPGLWQEWMGDFNFVYNVDLTLRSIGRIAFPIFCFLLVEGFLHTHNIKKYLIRLLIFAFVSDVPFDLAFFTKIGLDHQNVFFTLLLGMLALVGIDYINRKDKNSFNGSYKFMGKIGVLIAGVLGALGAITSMAVLVGMILYQMFEFDQTIPSLIFGFIVGIVIYLAVSHNWDEEKKIRVSASLFVTLFFFVAAELLHTDYGGWGVLAIIAIYVFRNSKTKGFAWGMIALTIKSVGEGVAFLDLIPLKFYNGQRGLKMKYFFYAFYPVHLLLLFLIRYWILGF